jgi:purine-nucleoside phosphorylase
MRPMKYEAVEQAKDYLLERIGTAPQFAIIMGSGLSAVDEILRDTTRIHYLTIPNFPVPKVAGHRGQVVFGKVGPTSVIVFEGRVHYYEGNTMDEVSFCARVIGSIGATSLLLTNAAGTVNPAFARGQLMLISDHINLIGGNPLSGPNDERWGARFLDQSQVYNSEFRQQLREAGQYCGLQLVEGVYAAVEGPTYETPAEARYLRAIGADAVGMSTVPEAIVARHMGLKVAGISMLANAAGGMSGKPVDHKEVLETASHMNADVGMLLQRFFENNGK